jgi:hypothetical protein
MVRGLSEGYHRDRNVLLFANDELEKLAIATQPTTIIFFLLFLFFFEMKILID